MIQGLTVFLTLEQLQCIPSPASGTGCINSPITTARSRLQILCSVPYLYI